MVDEYSGMIFGRVMKAKSEADLHLMNEITRLENLTGQRLKILHSDNGGEYRTIDLKEFCRNKGISQTFTTPYTPEYNPRAERSMRTIFEKARAMLAKALDYHSFSGLKPC